MKKRGVTEWLDQPSLRQILLSFYSPRTPRRVELITGIKKLKIKPFLEKNLLKPLNPEARKGRLYVITDLSRKLLKLPPSKNQNKINWALNGWILASPKQRLVVLKAIDTFKRNSEEIRGRTISNNPHLTRISTKSILKELHRKGLVETEIVDRKRYYWISEMGTKLKSEMELI